MIYQEQVWRPRVSSMARSLSLCMVANLVPITNPHGYPDWWHKLQARKRRDGGGNDDNTGQAAVVTAEPHMSLIPSASSNFNPGNALLGSNREVDCKAWILDSRATNHMMFDAADFSQHSTPRRTSIANANEAFLR